MFAVLFALLVGISDMCTDRGWTNTVHVQIFYADALRAAGHDSVVIPRTTDTNALRRVVRRLDAVVFSGGADVAPWRYRETPNKSYSNEYRDAYDFALMSACVLEKKPIVGICRGCQLVNVYFGGTLVQDIPSQWKVPEGCTRVPHLRYGYSGGATNPPTHTVTFAAGSRLAKVWGTDPVPTTSHHHQAVKDAAPGFRVVARAPDGVAEAIEHETLPVFGVQFHPELVAALRPKTGYDVERHIDFFRRLPELCGLDRH